MPQSDFYALGRTLIYLLTARLPNDPAIYDSRTNAFHWRPLAPQIAPPLADLIDDLIAPAAQDRPQTTDIILERLGTIRVGQVTNPPVQGASTEMWPETTLNPHTAQTQPDRLPLHKSLLRLKSPWAIAILLGFAALVYAIPRTLNLPGLNFAQTVVPAEPAASVPQYSVSEYRSLPGHTADVKDMLLLKDGQTLVTSSADETIRLWDLQTGAEIQRLTGHDSSVNALTFTTDQNTLVSAGADRRIDFWTLPEGEPVDQIEAAHDSSINALTVSHNGQWLASGDSSGVIKLWDLNTLEVIDTLTADDIGTINHLRFTRDDAYLASGGKSLQLWDLSAAEDPISLEGHTSFINRLEVSDDNQILISASADKTVRLWDIPTQTWKATLAGHQSFVNDVMVDGPRLWSADEAQTILMWDLNQEAPVRQLIGFDTDIWRFAMQPNDRIVTVGGDRHNITISVPSLEPIDD